MANGQVELLKSLPEVKYFSPRVLDAVVRDLPETVVRRVKRRSLLAGLAAGLTYYLCLAMLFMFVFPVEGRAVGAVNGLLIITAIYFSLDVTRDHTKKKLFRIVISAVGKAAVEHPSGVELETR